MGESMTPEQEAVWNQYWSGLIDFPTFQATYPGGGVPDGIGRIAPNIGCLTKQQTELIERTAAEIIARRRA
jgi:hypothetical protein